MTLFGLVHGGWHGPSCWDLLVGALAARGHRAVAMELPVDDPTAGARRYAEAVAGALAGEATGGPDAPVIVGHSLAGLVLPLLPDLVPVRRLVYLAPLLPLPGYSFDDQTARDRAILRRGLGAGLVQHGDGSSSWRPEAAVTRLYPDAPAGLAARYAARLRRQYWTITAEVTPLRRWPDVPADVVVCTGDGVVDPDRARAAARDRLGVTARELPGDHSPFVSRPEELADLLVTCGRTDDRRPRR